MRKAASTPSPHPKGSRRVPLWRSRARMVFASRRFVGSSRGPHTTAMVDGVGGKMLCHGASAERSQRRSAGRPAASRTTGSRWCRAVSRTWRSPPHRVGGAKPFAVVSDCDTRPRRKGGSGYAVLMIRPVAIRLPSSWSPAGAQEHADACDDDDPRCARGDAPS